LDFVLHSLMMAQVGEGSGGRPLEVMMQPQGKRLQTLLQILGMM